jgi:type VI secretion system secreted protein VgrG
MLDPIALSSPALPGARVVRATGAEGIHVLPRWTVDLLLDDPDLDLPSLPNTPALLAFTDDGAGPPREIPLVLVRAAYAGPTRDGHRYTLELSAPGYSLTLRKGYRIHQEKTTQEIVDRVLDDGVPGLRRVWRLSGRYARRVQCVQYAETNWAFVERLLAEDGIAYFWDLQDDAATIVFADGATSHDGIIGDVRVPFADASGMSRAETSFFELRREEELVHDSVHVRDYDPRHPDVFIEGRAGSGELEHFEFPARVPHDEAAAARAQARLEQLQRSRITAHGASGCARLQPGRVVRIEGAADDDFEGDWLVVEVTHAIVQSSRNHVGDRPYGNRVRMVPLSIDGESRTFRPDLPRSRPCVFGLETALVTGPAGEEIHVDDLGRVKLATRWDPDGVQDDRSSRWVRTLQMNLGGAMHLPRVGWEVAIAYADGHPDVPLVLGQLYNATNRPPYSLPEKKATTALRSATTPFDGTSNEIRFDDTAGNQEAFIHASNTQSVTVGGSATTLVGVEQLHDVHLGFGLGVKSQTVMVTASQNVAVAKDMAVVVKGARSETVGSESIGVTGSRRVDAGGSYTELIGALYGLRCNVANATVQGAYTELVGANLVTGAGLGTHQSVAAARVEIVGGSRNVAAASSCEDSTSGPKKVSAGAVTELGSGSVKTEAASLSISVGASATISAGGKVDIKASTVSIDVGGSLTAKGGSTLAISGSVNVSGGTTKLDAPLVTKKSSAKVEA